MIKKTLFFISFLFAGGLLAFLILETPFSNHRWLSKEHEDQKRKDFVFNEFLQGEDFVIAIRLKEEETYFSKTFLDSLQDFVEKLEKVQWVEKVESPLHATTIVQKANQMHIQTFQEGLQNKTIDGLQAYQSRLQQSDYYGRLISKDERSIAVVVHLNLNLDTKEDSRRRQNLITSTGDILKEYPQFSQNYFTGSVFLYDQMDELSRSNLLFFMPLSIALVLLLLYLVFGHFLKMFLVTVCACFALLAIFGIFFIFQHPLTVVSMTLPILVLVIAVADAIHILARWEIYYKEDADVSLTLKKVFKETWLPCLFTSVTTAIGFGSFYFSELLPLKYFGLDSFVGILLSYIVIITSMGLGLAVFTPIQKRPLQREGLKEKETLAMNAHLILDTFLSKSCHSFVSQHYKFICISTLVLSLLFSATFPFIYTETNFLHAFFKEKSFTRQSFNYVDAHLGGAGGVDLLVEASEKDAFNKIAPFNQFILWKAQLSEHFYINHTQSYLEPVSMMHKELSLNSKVSSPVKQVALMSPSPSDTKVARGVSAVSIPISKERAKSSEPFQLKRKSYPNETRQLAQELLFLEFSRNDEDRGILASYMNFDYSKARFHLQTPNLSSKQQGKLFAFIRTIIPEKVGALKVFLTGDDFYSYKLSNYVINTQFLTIFITLILVWIFFIFYFGFTLGTLGMIPNIAPVLLTMGSIILLKIPYDFATVLIGSISLGLCVDDSIHFLHYYKLQRKKGLALENAISLTLRHLGRPICFTTFLFSIAFAVFTLADFVMLLRFGLFTLMAIGLALLANILVLPAFLFWWKKA